MSFTIVNILNQKSVRAFRTFANSWGSGPAAWNWLWRKYIGGDPRWIYSEQDAARLWDLLEMPEMETHHKIVLTLTYDHCYTPIADLKEVAEACIKFHADSDTGEWVNHWGSIGSVFNELSLTKFHHAARGVCLSQVSSGDLWRESEELIFDAFPVFARAPRLFVESPA